MAVVAKRLTAKAKARKKKKYFTNNQTGKKELAPPPGYVPEKKKPAVKAKPFKMVGGKKYTMNEKGIYLDKDGYGSKALGYQVPKSAKKKPVIMGGEKYKKNKKGEFESVKKKPEKAKTFKMVGDKKYTLNKKGVYVDKDGYGSKALGYQIPIKKKPVAKKKKAKGYPKSVFESKEWDEKGWKKSKKPAVKKKPVAKKKKEQKIPPGGISLGSSSTTTWKQTPTSKAVDDREYKKKSKRWLRSKNKSWANQPVRPPSVGASATIKRKTDAKGDSRSSFSGPGGMKPKWMDLYGNWMEKQEKLKKKK